MSNVYKKIYQRFREARKENNLESIKKAFLFFTKELEKLIKKENLKYSDLTFFAVTDDKFLFPVENIKTHLDPYGPLVEIKTEGFLIEILRALDLMNYKNLIYDLQEKLSELHMNLSLNRKEEVEKYKKEVLEILEKLKNL